MNRPGPSARVGIIGGGAAGLSAALALRDAGYRHVTVLEAEPRAGGKCHSFEWQGRTYELGAGAVTSAYRHVRALLDEHGLRLTPGASGLFVDVDDGSRSFVPPSLRGRSVAGLPGLGLAGVRLAKALYDERAVLEPGMDGLHPGVMVPFAEWARRRKLDAIVPLLRPWVTGFGYGYFDEVPAAYVLKYVALFRLPVYEILEGGYGELWQRVARGLDVRLGARVVSVDRSGEEVRVETVTGRHAFDALIVACPPERALEVLDADDEERALFGALQYVDYDVVAARVERPTRARYGFFPQHLERAHAGRPVFFYRRWLDRDLVLFYSLAPRGAPLSETTRAVHETVAATGGRVLSIEREHRWRYFPHVGPAEMAGGWYSRFESRQGARRTWVVGEVGSFSAVEPVVAYSYALVARHFARG